MRLEANKISIGIKAINFYVWPAYIDVRTIFESHGGEPLIV